MERRRRRLGLLRLHLVVVGRRSSTTVGAGRGEAADDDGAPGERRGRARSRRPRRRRRAALDVSVAAAAVDAPPRRLARVQPPVDVEPRAVAAGRRSDARAAVPCRPATDDAGVETGGARDPAADGRRASPAGRGDGERWVEPRPQHRPDRRHRGRRGRAFPRARLRRQPVPTLPRRRRLRHVPARPGHGRRRRRRGGVLPLQRAPPRRVPAAPAPARTAVGASRLLRHLDGGARQARRV